MYMWIFFLFVLFSSWYKGILVFLVLMFYRVMLIVVMVVMVIGLWC